MVIKIYAPKGSVNPVVQIVNNRFLSSLLVDQFLFTNHVQHKSVTRLGEISSRFRNELDVSMIRREKLFDAQIDLSRNVFKLHISINPRKPATNINCCDLDPDLCCNINRMFAFANRLVKSFCGRTSASYVETEPNHVEFQCFHNRQQVFHLAQFTPKLLVELAFTFAVVDR